MVSLSSRRPLRESPRLLGAGVGLALCLLLIGLLIGLAISPSSPARTSSPSASVKASAHSGSAAPSGSTVARLQHTVVSQTAALRHDRAALSALQTRLKLAQRRTAHKTAALRRSRRAARCWRTRAEHPTDTATCTS